MTKKKILVVEDESIIAEDIRACLHNLGYVVPAIASTGDMAVKKAEETNPDLVMMDIILKDGMDGIEAAEQIYSRFNIPVVYLSAYSDEKTFKRAKITEPFGYIVKPFKERELYITIEIALFKHRMEKKLKESREWFSVTLKSISDAVIATDSKGCVVFMNPVSQSMTGWKIDEAKGKPLRDVFNIISEKQSIQDSLMRPAREGDGLIEADQTVLIAKDGRRTLINASSDPIRDDRGNIIGIVVVFRGFYDISSNKI